MTPHKHQPNKTSLMYLAILGPLAVFTTGCSWSQTNTSSLVSTSVTRQTAPTTAHDTLAAADRLGKLIFGSPSTVAEPKLPSHWTVVQAPATR